MSTQNPPKVIFLQWWEDEFGNKKEDVTWSFDKIDEDDIEYHILDNSFDQNDIAFIRLRNGFEEVYKGEFNFLIECIKKYFLKNKNF